MAYPFVAAKYDYGPRHGPALALLVHMAEGGNTVSYLHNSPARGVSVHFVVQYSGTVVQMLNLNRTSGSVNPATLRTDEGPAPYGYSVAKQVMGSWWADPNEAVISAEVEGFAATGPNAQQAAALVTWANDMRTKLPQLVGALGHRDFQNVKPCPGAHIDWASIGGHGLWHSGGGNVPPGDDMNAIFEPYAGTATVRAGTMIYQGPDLAATTTHRIQVDGVLEVIGKVTGWRVAIVNPTTAAWLAAGDVVDGPALPSDYVPVTEQLYRKA